MSAKAQPAMPGVMDEASMQMPYAPQVICAQCKLFEPDTVGDGMGIGECLHPDAPVDFPDGGDVERCYDTKHKLHSWRRPSMRQPLYPNIERRCAGFVKQEGV